MTKNQIEGRIAQALSSVVETYEPGVALSKDTVKFSTAYRIGVALGKSGDSMSQWLIDCAVEPYASRGGGVKQGYATKVCSSEALAQLRTRSK